MVSALLFLLALLMMLAAVLSVLRARRLEQIARVNQRLTEVAFLNLDSVQRPARQLPVLADLDLWLQRVEIKVSPSIALVILALIVMAGLLLWRAMGPFTALVGWGLAGVIIVLVPQVRYRQKVNRIVAQIPLFVDQVVRGLVTGRNIEGAIKLATEDLQEPLREVVMKAQKSVELGADLGESFKEAAQFLDIKELHMLALTIHSSRVYGGSPRDMLESIVNLIRQRQQAREELRALTGETRVTAWVLGLTPTVIAGFTFWRNPSYLLGMWNDPTGQVVLLCGALMQIAGALAMWRMIKSM